MDIELDPWGNERSHSIGSTCLVEIDCAVTDSKLIVEARSEHGEPEEVLSFSTKHPLAHLDEAGVRLLLKHCEAWLAHQNKEGHDVRNCSTCMGVGLVDDGGIAHICSQCKGTGAPRA